MELDHTWADVVRDVILAFIASSSFWGVVLLVVRGRDKRATAKLVADTKLVAEKGIADIKGTQSAQAALLQTQLEDHRTTNDTIIHLRKEVDASNALTANANAQATLAFSKSDEATKANTLLQLDLQRLQIAQVSDKERIADLELKVGLLTDTNTGLTGQVAGLTKTNDLLLGQVTDLKNLNRDLQAQVKALQETNEALQLQVKQLVNILQDKVPATRSETK